MTPSRIRSRWFKCEQNNVEEITCQQKVHEKIEQEVDGQPCDMTLGVDEVEALRARHAALFEARLGNMTDTRISEYFKMENI